MTTLRSCILALCLIPSAATATAQPSDASAYTGYELALSGARTVRAGRIARFHGVAYRVRGLATLVPYAGPVRARVLLGEADEARVDWVRVSSNPDGRFSVDVPVEVPEIEGAEASLRVEVGPEDGARALEFSLELRPAVQLMLRTDRALYQSSEPVHVFGLLRDELTGRPVANETVEVALRSDVVPSTEVTLQSDAAGVITFDTRVPPNAHEGAASVIARIPGQREETASFRVGTRTYERLFASVEVEPDPVAPGAVARVIVTVTANSGAPIAGASVSLRVDRDVEYGAVSQADGRAILDVTVPAYHEHETGSIPIVATVTHHAHGSLTRSASMHIEVPRILTLELVPRVGGLVPEIDDVLFLRLRDGFYGPPSSAQRVTLTGPAFRDGSITVSTDENGLAEVPVRLPRGAASGDVDDAALAETVVRATIHGTVDRLTRHEVPVLRGVEVIPVLARPVVDVGVPLQVSLTRSAAAARLPIVVEALSERGELLAVRYVAPSERTAQLDLPPDSLGLISVRARAIHADESWSGRGGIARVIVRPARPDFLSLTPTRTRWTVGETATLTLHTHAGLQGHAAILVRDLAAHGGESPFEEHFLRRRFDEAVLDPSTPAAERVARTLLAADTPEIDSPALEAPPLLDALGIPADESLGFGPSQAGVLRDPFPLAHELERRGIASAMRFAETSLVEALDGRTLDAISAGAGAARRFRDDLFDGQDFVTLGGEPLRPALLTAIDPSFTFANVARRVARRRLVALLASLTAFLDPGDSAAPAARMAAREPYARWLPRMLELGILEEGSLDDPFGGRFALRPTQAPTIVVSAHALGLELFSPGPDGRAGTADDVRDPFGRVVPAGTPYAVASGEDALLRSLAVMSPIRRTLELLQEAYGRINVEMTEEEIGDAVAGGVGEGTIGLGFLGATLHGTGRGTGSGYGSGAGGLRGRSSSTPQVRAGSISSGLASIVRERFPPTLLFERHLVIDPSGATTIRIPLADAVTTYLVEALVWREDGWIWSVSERIEVDRDIVVDAPVPSVARRGDRIELPIRVSNRGDHDRTVQVSLRGDASIGVSDVAPVSLTLAAGADGVVPVELRFDQLGEGTLTSVVSDSEGAVLDAVRRPVRVLPPTRRVLIVKETLSDSAAEVVFEVPPGAVPHDANLRLTVGVADFPPSAAPAFWPSWAPFGGTPSSPSEAPTSHVLLPFWIAGEWSAGRALEDSVDQVADTLSMVLSRAERTLEPERLLHARCAILLGLSPFSRPVDGRAVPPGIAALIERLRRDISARALLEEDPLALSRAAAALAWSGRGDEGHELLVELSRRLERQMIQVGDRTFVPSSDTVRSTLMFAMTEQALGRRGLAFALLRAVGSARDTIDEHARGEESRDSLFALARSLITRMNEGAHPERATVIIDGTPRQVALVDGAAQLDLRELATPGRHVITVRARGPLSVHVASRFGVPWEPPAARGPYALRLEGEVGARDETTSLELVVSSRVPRTIPETVLEVELPTGAEVSQAARDELPFLVEVGGGVMTVRLPPLRPGNVVRVPLPLRWTLAGRLSGVGVAAYPADRPGSVSVRVPEPLDISAIGGGQ